MFYPRQGISERQQAGFKELLFWLKNIGKNSVKAIFKALTSLESRS
jgi:hypothetical protein